MAKISSTNQNCHVWFHIISFPVIIFARISSNSCNTSVRYSLSLCLGFLSQGENRKKHMETSSVSSCIFLPILLSSVSSHALGNSFLDIREFIRCKQMYD
ncbi:hypothetical protein MRB53_035134 [Persea americana]|uniref:Uncharacterized protein n=1 Tax=Persea americana TaxID=3435 RepID=A0ACC2K3R3_PERAE|nr:hypothetical protein MRB53_035134 [Persea americana]